MNKRRERLAEQAWEREKTKICPAMAEPLLKGLGYWGLSRVQLRELSEYPQPLEQITDIAIGDAWLVLKRGAKEEEIRGTLDSEQRTAVGANRTRAEAISRVKFNKDWPWELIKERVLKALFLRLWKLGQGGRLEWLVSSLAESDVLLAGIIGLHKAEITVRYEPVFEEGWLIENVWPSGVHLMIHPPTARNVEPEEILVLLGGTIQPCEHSALVRLMEKGLVEKFTYRAITTDGRSVVIYRGRNWVMTDATSDGAMIPKNVRFITGESVSEK